MSKEKARHFHAGKLRKEINGTEFVSVKEGGDTLFVSRDGLPTSAPRKCGGYTWTYEVGHV